MTVRGVLLLLVAVVLSGCRIDVGTEVSVDRRGGGEVAVAVRIDGATLRELDRAGVDPELDVALALGPDTAWRSERVIDADGGLVLTYRRAFSDGEEATALLAELSADVAPQDPALRLDVTVITTRSGAVRLAGTGALAPPATLGVRLDGVPVGPSGDELAAAVAEAVDATFVVRVPGRVVEHDADAVADGVLRWDLPVGAPRTIVLVAEPGPLWRRVAWWGWAGSVAVAAAGAVRWRTRRRGSGAPEADAGISPAG